MRTAVTNSHLTWWSCLRVDSRGQRMSPTYNDRFSRLPEIRVLTSSRRHDEIEMTSHNQPSGSDICSVLLKEISLCSALNLFVIRFVLVRRFWCLFGADVGQRKFFGWIELYWAEHVTSDGTFKWKRKNRQKHAPPCPWEHFHIRRIRKHLLMSL